MIFTIKYVEIHVWQYERIEISQTIELWEQWNENSIKVS